MIYTHAAAALAGLAIGFSGAWKVQAWRHDSAEKVRIERAAQDLKRATEAQDRAVSNFIQEQSNAKTVYQRIEVEVDKIVERPVYRNVCLDSDGLRELHRAIDGADPRPNPVQPVPTSSQAR